MSKTEKKHCSQCGQEKPVSSFNGNLICVGCVSSNNTAEVRRIIQKKKKGN